MTRKKHTSEENARREKIRELLQMANIGSMDDIQNLFKETIAEFMENGLEAELEDELAKRVLFGDLERGGEVSVDAPSPDAEHLSFSVTSRK